MIQGFDFSVEHVSGTRNKLADALSRNYLRSTSIEESISSKIRRLSKRKRSAKNLLNLINQTYLFIKHSLGISVKYNDIREVILSCPNCRDTTSTPYTLRQPFSSFVSEYPMQHLVGDVLYMNENEDGKQSLLSISSEGLIKRDEMVFEFDNQRFDDFRSLSSQTKYQPSDDEEDELSDSSQRAIKKSIFIPKYVRQFLKC
eukprot:gene6247-10255_t